MALLMLAAVAVALGPRPAELTGPDPSRYQAKVAEAAGQLATLARGQSCADTSLKSLRGVEPSAAWLAQNGIVRTGASGPVFQEHVEVSGCGAALRVRMLTVRRGEDWGLIALPPGAGVVGPRLFRDMQPSLAGALGVKEVKLACGEPERRVTRRLADTALLTPYRPGAPWSERWTYVVCRQAIPIDIAFTPASDGGTDYSIRVN